MKIANLVLFLALFAPGSSLKACEGGNNKHIVALGKMPIPASYINRESTERAPAGQPPLPLIRATPKDPTDGHDNIWDIDDDYSYEKAIMVGFFRLVDGVEWVGKKLGVVTQQQEQKETKEKGQDSGT